MAAGSSPWGGVHLAASWTEEEGRKDFEIQQAEEEVRKRLGARQAGKRQHLQAQGQLWLVSCALQLDAQVHSTTA
jgi:hypothetical protein